MAVPSLSTVVFPRVMSFLPLLFIFFSPSLSVYGPIHTLVYDLTLHSSTFKSDRSSYLLVLSTSGNLCIDRNFQWIRRDLVKFNTAEIHVFPIYHSKTHDGFTVAFSSSMGPPLNAT